MNYCNYTQDTLISDLIKICDICITKNLNSAQDLFAKEITNIIDSVKQSPNSNEQLKVITDTFNNIVYNSPGDPYCDYISDLLLPKQMFNLIINPEYNKQLAPTSSMSFEEVGKARKSVRSKNYLDKYFTKAPNVKEYFLRKTKSDFVDTFIVNCKADIPKPYTNQKELLNSICEYKQTLLNDIFSYLETTPLANELNAISKQMYNKEIYTGVLEELKPIMQKCFSFDESFGRKLENIYKDFNRENVSSKNSAKLYINAYNAWVMLQNFDRIIKDNFSTIVIVSPKYMNTHIMDDQKYKINTKASNMWETWTTSDDIEHMSDVISDITQLILDTRKRYDWGSNQPYSDQNVSFNDFMYTIGIIKKLINNKETKNIGISNDPELISNLSFDSQILIEDILSDNKEKLNGKAVTFDQILARISENPQRVFHAIFDLLCNTDILDTLNDEQIGKYEKGLIWSFYKELFGAGNQNPRSIYNMYINVNQDHVYEIITQLSATTFPEEYVQYYETNDGSIGTRLLKGFALENVRNEIERSIQLTSSAINIPSDQIEITTELENNNSTKYILSSVKYKPIPEFTVFINKNGNIEFGTSNVYNEEVWNKLIKHIREILDIDFENNKLLESTFLELTNIAGLRSYENAMKNIGKILANIAFVNTLNTKIAKEYDEKTTTHESALRKFLIQQFGEDKAKKYLKGLDVTTGLIPVFRSDNKAALLDILALAQAMSTNTLSSAQSKTGEGTSISNYVLSRLRNCYHNQIEMQCKNPNSAVKNLTFVKNENNLFEGIATRRELKLSQTNQQATKFSDQQSFHLTFVNDFISAFIPENSNSYFQQGLAGSIPTVNSDKSQIDELLQRLFSKATYHEKSYLEMDDIELEEEMIFEFKTVYPTVIHNINKELGKLIYADKQIKIAFEKIRPSLKGLSPLEINKKLLYTLNECLVPEGTKNPKKIITEKLHEIITKYNLTHRRNPIMLCQQVHYIFNKNGYLTNNKTLEALYGRFNDTLKPEERKEIQSLYENETLYKTIAKNENINDLSSVKAFFEYQDYLTVKDLLEMKFKLPLYGSDFIVRHEQPEIQFLRGDYEFTGSDNISTYLQNFNSELKDWVDKRTGLMIIAKNEKREAITTTEQLKKAKNLFLHPLLAKFNRVDYLNTQQYTISTVGSHYIHKGGADDGHIVSEESSRWLSSNKRNVAETSTVQLYQNKQLTGSPAKINMAIYADTHFDLYNAMGDLYKEGHAPLDGSMLMNAFTPELFNNSLAGERAGNIQKPFGTFYDERYAAGGIIKTAGFPATNRHMRRNKSWANLQKNMSNKVWIQEFADENGNDAEEVLDITKNYLGEHIDYVQVVNGIFYQRPLLDSKTGQPMLSLGNPILAAFKLGNIEYQGDNTYKITEHEVKLNGDVTGHTQTRIVHVNTNWKLFTEIFGGHHSLELGPDNKLTWSENSIKLVVHAINNVGYKKTKNYSNDDLDKHFKSRTKGLTQDDIWQPLKYSDIHLLANEGAIKSLQFNMNPNGEKVINEELDLNFMTFRLAQFGIQLDKEHHADLGEVTMPTQIIQALANRSFSSDYAKEAYDALAVLTRQATEPYLEGISEFITNVGKTENPQEKLVTEITNLIVNTLLKQTDEKNSVNAVMSELLAKAEKGEELKFVDINEKIAWSNPTIYKKIFSTLSSVLTNVAVKMKFSGSLAIICPSDTIEYLNGDKLFSSFSKISNEDGSTRVIPADVELERYQMSVKEGNEVDYQGNNLLIFNDTRDLNAIPKSELPEVIRNISPNTASFNVVIDPNLRTTYKNYPNSIIAYRIGDYTNPISVQNGIIGNPFSEQERGENTVEQFYNWIVTGNNYGNVKATNAFRNAIIEKIIQTPENTAVMYYTELNRPSHATVIGYLIQNKHLLKQEAERNKLIKQKKLSQVSKLKTQHNYIIEFADGTSNEITINTPDDYFNIKNLILSGKKINSQIPIIDLFDYDSVYNRYLKEAKDIDFSSTPEGIVRQKLSSPILLQESVKKELNYGKEELKKLFGVFLSKEKGGVSIERLAEMIWEENPEVFQDDYEVRNLILDVISSSYTTGDFKNYAKKLEEQYALNKTDEEFELHKDYIYQQTGYEYNVYENIHKYLKQGRTPVVNIYENVKKGRSLSAYNVRFSDKYNPERQFQLYDLDSVHMLFHLNKLKLKPPKGVIPFKDASNKQEILNKIATSKLWKTDSETKVNEWDVIYYNLKQVYNNIPEKFDDNFVASFDNDINRLEEVVNKLYDLIKPWILNKEQDDLFILSGRSKESNILVNGELITPTNIQKDAYELIMPKIYKTQFGLREFDDLQSIVSDKDFFLKRAVERFDCKLKHHEYDYELKNFNGEHVYILDESKGIPEDFVVDNIQSIEIQKRKNRIYRIQDDKITHELSSENDTIYNKDGVEIIITKNPDFYIKNFNYNTLKVSPTRVTEESYKKLIEIQKSSSRKNNQNFLKAITYVQEDKTTINPLRPVRQYFSFNDFVKFNEEIDNITIDNVTLNLDSFDGFKSTAQLCKILNQMGRELYTSFNESLNLIAARIPAQSQQSFMTQRVVGFDDADVNTAIVSTFQLFLQGSDLDIDAVTLLGYSFDKNGKFAGWSPYFQLNNVQMLEASKTLPMPTGQIQEVNVSEDTLEDLDFLNTYSKYFGTAFKMSEIKKGKLPTIYVDTYTPEGIRAFAEFLKEFNQKGINIKGKLNADGKTLDASSITNTLISFPVLNLESFPIDASNIYYYANQILNIANNHNNYVNTVDDYLKELMIQNVVVKNIYNTAAEPCNQTEAQVSLDVSTQIYKYMAKKSTLSNPNEHAPGRVTSKIKSIGEGQAGKEGVGIGAVGIKANSTTQFYLWDVLNNGSEDDLNKIFFPGQGYTINGKTYKCFANMYVGKDTSNETREKFREAFEIIDKLTSKDQVTEDVACHIGALLSLAVDNAKDLALAKINSGPRLMGLYIYGTALGIPVTDLIKIITSKQGLILKELLEGDQINGDTNSFKVLDVFKKLEGDLGGDLNKYDCNCLLDDKIQKYTIKDINNKNIIVKTPTQALFAALYHSYTDWYSTLNPQNRPAFPKNLKELLEHVLQINQFEKLMIKKSNTLKISPIEVLNHIKNAFKNSPDFVNWNASLEQLLDYIYDMSNKINIFNDTSDTYKLDLKILAEGAEEMRILGSILSSNKGLKTNPDDAEIFIETIENLIYDRKKILNQNPTDSDKFNILQFWFNEEYQEQCIKEYEKVKHSVNILHLISRVPHFKGYLKTGIIPDTFYSIVSIKARSIRKYRRNVESDSSKSTSLFNFFGVESQRDKKSVLSGLENLIQYKLFSNWLFENKITFIIPKGFQYFSSKGNFITNEEDSLEIQLWTDHGLATFKKYMEEYYIPKLKNNPNYQNNLFVKDLHKIGFDKTPVHNSINVYSLSGDLMANKGRQKEINMMTFADFQAMCHITFDGNKIPSAADAFYLYAQYCYMGKKGQKSLMTLFDDENARGSLAKSFDNYVAYQDAHGEINCSKEQIITWCAPVGTQYSKAKYVYATANDLFMRSLQQKTDPNAKINYEELEDQGVDLNETEEVPQFRKKSKYVPYNNKYLATNYDRLTHNNFLIPFVNQTEGIAIPFSIDVNNTKISLNTFVQNGKINIIEIIDTNLPQELKSIIENISKELQNSPVTYVTSLSSDYNQEIDLSTIITAIEQKINCK